ncbi:MAG: hypothetical protein ABR955_10605, partial [Verrucomicrobiota bacterium]
MNKILIITIILGISFGSSAEDATIKQLLRSSDAVIWAGLDYSMVRVIGNSDTIKVPNRLMQNGCFLSEPFFFMVKPITDRCGTRIFARRMARLTA